MVATGAYICGSCKIVICQRAVQKNTQEMYCISRPRKRGCCVRDGTLGCLQQEVQLEQGTPVGNLGLFASTARLGVIFHIVHLIKS